MIAFTISEASKLSFSGRRIARSFSFAWALRLWLAAAIAVWFIRAHSQRQAAAALFAEAKDPAAWRAVIEKYPGSAPPPMPTCFWPIRCDERASWRNRPTQYEKFLAAFPKSSLLGGARLGLAENMAVAGKTDEALAALQSLRGKGRRQLCRTFRRPSGRSHPYAEWKV